MSDEAACHQRLLELVEAEDAANGEVGCGRDLGKGLSEYLILLANRSEKNQSLESWF